MSTDPRPDLTDLGLTRAEAVSGVIPDAVWPSEGDDGWMYPGTIGFIAGPSGSGKSLASTKIMADWTRTRGHVILCEGEDGGIQGGMSKIRLEAASARFDRLSFAEFRLPSEISRLEAAIVAIGGKVLVVFDTAETFIDAPAQGWGKALSPLSEMAARTGAIVILVHHTLKNAKKNGDWRAAIGGATAGLTGKSRFGALYGPRPDDPSQRLLVPVKDSYRDPTLNGMHNRSVAFEFDEEDIDDGSGKLRAVSYLRIAEKNVSIANPVSIVYLGGDGAGQKGPSPEKAAQAAEFVTRYLKDGARPISDAGQCQTHPDGNPAKKQCGTMAASKCEGGCPYCGGPTVLVQGMKESAEEEGISWGMVKKAFAAIQTVSDRKGSKDAPGGLVFSQRLPDNHPSANPDPNVYKPVLG